MFRKTSPGKNGNEKCTARVLKPGGNGIIMVKKGVMELSEDD
ncbi:hypothetical protein HMPREF1326_02078 [Akkermansia sp. KLE1605]|nr:hypothetical protein HMPREF1326_02078 [Akkermansia sp. KLE1605]